VAVIVTTPILADAVASFAEAAPDRVRGVVLAAGDPADLAAAVARVFG
jgi:hypothetical protein